MVRLKQSTDGICIPMSDTDDGLSMTQREMRVEAYKHLNKAQIYLMMAGPTNLHSRTSESTERLREVLENNE